MLFQYRDNNPWKKKKTIFLNKGILEELQYKDKIEKKLKKKVVFIVCLIFQGKNKQQKIDEAAAWCRGDDEAESECVSERVR